MPQESSFARQTRRPLYSLDAVQHKRRVLARLPVILYQRNLQSSRSKRNQFATAGPSGESPRHRTLRTRAFTLAAGVRMEEKKCF
jgi:hypothetical protein